MRSGALALLFAALLVVVSEPFLLKAAPLSEYRVRLILPVLVSTSKPPTPPNPHPLPTMDNSTLISIGFFAALTGMGGRWLVEARYRDFFMAGICGGFTTFSAFSLQTLVLAQEGEWVKAGGYVVLSVVLCLLGVWFGYFLATTLNPVK
jgi:protein CrcB